MAEAGSRRLPDFVIIGAMKAGTTSLFRWLGDHPDCDLPDAKEPHFFSQDAEYERGTAFYRRYFADTDPDRTTGEASASYADPRIAATVAQRMHDTLPAARLIYLVRDPEQRLRSHYLHERQRSREQRPLPDALADPVNPYAAMSCYADALEPFLSHYGRESVLLVRLADLAGAESTGWHRVSAFLGLRDVAGTSERSNETRSKVAFNPLLLRLWEAGWLERAKALPAPVRRAGRAVLGRSTSALQAEGAAVRQQELPTELRSRLADQWTRVHSLMGETAPALGADDLGQLR